MNVSPTLSTFLAYFLAGLGAGFGWFISSWVTHKVLR